jgi:hypothetical protein
MLEMKMVLSAGVPTAHWGLLLAINMVDGWNTWNYLKGGHALEPRLRRTWGTHTSPLIVVICLIVRGRRRGLSPWVFRVLGTYVKRHRWDLVVATVSAAVVLSQRRKVCSHGAALPEAACRVPPRRTGTGSLQRRHCVHRVGLDHTQCWCGLQDLDSEVPATWSRVLT